MQQQPWSGGDLFHAGDSSPSPQTRSGISSFGESLARPNSEPPAFHLDPNAGNDLVGNDLLNRLTEDFSPTFYSETATPLTSNSLSREMAELHLGGPMFPEYAPDPRRSHSAQPQKRPPPGLAGLQPLKDRSASTGTASRPIKPSAKTLVDLIQEDYPDQPQSPLDRLVRSPVHRQTPPYSPYHQSFESRTSPRSPSGRQYAPALPNRTQLQRQIIYGAPQQQRQLQQVVSQRPVIVNANQGYSYASYPMQQLQQPPQQTMLLNDQFVSVVPVQNQVYWQDPQVPVQPMSREPPLPQYGRRSVDNKSRAGGGGGRQRRRDKGSSLLDDIRMSKTRDWSLRQIEGHIVEFCQDQNGSRFIQQRLEMGDAAEQEICMKELLPAIRKLRNDVFGNYVVQKLLDFGTPSTKLSIRQTLEGEVLPLSLQMYGCRVVQKALEALDEDDLPKMLREFHHNVLSCIHDQNGNHVIQKCIEVVSTKSKKALQNGDIERSKHLREQIDFIIDDIMRNMMSLSCHPYGCRVVQRILEHCDEYKRLTVLDEIQKCHRKLLGDQYGNYVIQHVLQFGRTSDRDSILHIIVDTGLLGLARQKFASNVVEKLLKHGNGSHRRAVAREMLKLPKAHDAASNTEHMSTAILMVRDAYANYVVQTTLDVVPESEEKQNLLHELTAHLDDLKNYTFAKHIVSKLELR